MPVDLPVTATPLVGREAELATIAAALRRAEIRLLTLTGAPGIGKTRLAVEAARAAAAAFAHGTVFVDLAQVTDPARVSWAVAQRLGIRPRARLPAAEALIRALRERHLLLVLDSFEHVVEAAPEVAAWLAAAPQLKVLVTSREPLRLMWEHQIAVPPLQVPDLHNLPDPAALPAVPAVALFLSRARAVDYAFGLTPENARAVAEICVRLDGLPLALELAAGQVKALSPEAIRERLDHRLTLLQRAARDLPARHRTLRAAVGWSYSRLAPPQQALFRRLAVFVGDFALDAAAAVCADVEEDVLPGLAALVDKSLLRLETEPGGTPRFRMLETIREFALEQLVASGDVEQAQRRHTEFSLALVERAEPELTGREQAGVIHRLERDYPNLRAALDRVRAEGGDAALLPRFVAALWRFWNVRGYWMEGRQWTEAALPLVEAAPPSLRLRVLHGAAVLAWRVRDYTAATSLAKQAVDLAGQLEDHQTAAHCLRTLALIARDRQEMVRARELAVQSLARFESLSDSQGIATALRLVGFVAIEGHDFRSAREPFERSLVLSRELGDDRGAAWSTYGLAATALAEGDLVQAAALGGATRRAFEALGERDGMAQALVHLGRVALVRGDHDEARQFHEEALRTRRALGDPGMVASSLGELAVVAQDAGADDRAIVYYRESLGLFQRAGDRLGLARCLEGLALLAADHGQVERAARLFGAADALLDRIGITRWPGWFPSGPRPERLARARSGAEDRLGSEAFRRAVAAGAGLSLSVAVAEALGVEMPFSPPGPMPRPVDPLTPREREVAGLIALGLSNREIARRLFISENTAATHVQHILGKLDFASRAQVAAWAVERSLKPSS